MNVLKNRKISFIISLSIMVVGLIMFFINGLNYGIDFTGGTLIQIKIGKFISVDEAKEIMDEYDKDASVLHVGTEKDEIIIKSTLDFSNQTILKLIDGFTEKYNIPEGNILSDKVGPSMGAEIRNKALLSMLIAGILMLLYITWRFEFKFGIAAIFALVHDVLIMLSMYAILRIPVDGSFIVAILTIIGYSINDTIVIFDRIRENLKLHPKESIENTINNSIKSSLTRTVYTTVTTVMAVLMLYIFGVEDIRILALPLIIGMLTGVYSSLFIASSLWYELKTRKMKTAK